MRSAPASDRPLLGVALCLLSGLVLACGVSGEKGAVTPGPEVSLTANPTVVPAGGTTTLTWVVTGATGCVASNDWSGSKGAGGGDEDIIVSNESTYTLTCTDATANGGSDTAIVKIESPPSSAWDAAEWGADVWN